MGMGMSHFFFSCLGWACTDWDVFGGGWVRKSKSRDRREGESKSKNSSKKKRIVRIRESKSNTNP